MIDFRYHLVSIIAVFLALGWAWFEQLRKEVQAGVRQGRLLCDNERFSDAEFILHRDFERTEWLPWAG